VAFESCRGDMVSTVRKLISPEEYLAIERAAETRSEYLNGEMFAMSGTSYAHTRIKGNIAYRASVQLEGGPCEVLTSDMRVKVSSSGLYTYPDLIILCGKPELEDSYFDTLLNPQVLVEVLSDSTEKYDRGLKFEHYRRIPTLREYILVSQNRILVERFARQLNNSWNLQTFDDPKGVFPFATVAIQIPMQDIYHKVDFESARNQGP
jgi:Uma2 family endonuclease